MRPRAGWELIALVSVAAICADCGKASPAGFWTSYQRNAILNQASDQGPWGGSRWIHWLGNEPDSFRLGEVRKFALKNGWTCEEPNPYSADRMESWVGRNGPVFPMFFGEPGSQYPENDNFPRHILGDSIIVRCETGWIRVAPGSGESSPAFGYIQIASDGRRMAVYHLWGEV